MATAELLERELDSLSVERVEIVDEFGEITIGELGTHSDGFLPTAISSCYIP